MMREHDATSTATFPVFGGHFLVAGLTQVVSATIAQQVVYQRALVPHLGAFSSVPTFGWLLVASPMAVVAILLGGRTRHSSVALFGALEHRSD